MRGDENNIKPEGDSLHRTRQMGIAQCCSGKATPPGTQLVSSLSVLCGHPMQIETTTKPQSQVSCSVSDFPDKRC